MVCLLLIAFFGHTLSLDLVQKDEYILWCQQYSVEKPFLNTQGDIH